jgi:hypothetical protein
MKYSQIIGIVASVILISLCFTTWVYIPSLQLNLTGFKTSGTNWGKPGLMHIYLSGINILLFLIPKIWAKRTNVFFAGINLAWAVRNFIVISSCFMGECPEKQISIYLLIVFAFIILIMSLLPKIKVQ